MLTVSNPLTAKRGLTKLDQARHANSSARLRATWIVPKYFCESALELGCKVMILSMNVQFMQATSDGTTYNRQSYNR
jgi:hypothetical protein